VVKKKIVITAIVVVLVAAGVFYRMNTGNIMQVETYEVKRGNVSKYVEETGTVKSDNKREVTTTVSGKIKKLNVQVGDVVKRGDIMAEMDFETIDLEIKSLKAQLEGLRAEYKETLKPADEEQIAKAKVNIDSAKLGLEEAKRKLENNKKLYDEGVISYEAYKASIDAVVIKENSLEIAQKELELLQKGISQNVKNKYKYQIEQMAYQIDILEKRKNDYFVKAPIDGIITEISLEEGSFVQPGMEILEVGNEEAMYIETDILVSEIGGVKEGAKTLVYNEDIGIPHIKGEVRKIYPKAFNKVSDLGIEQKRVRVEIDIPNNVPKLKLGYDMDVKILTHFKENIITVPENSVFELEDGQYVFIAQNGKAVLRRVKTGIEGEDMIEIVSGIKEGEKVIISPHKDLEEGMDIEEI